MGEVLGQSPCPPVLSSVCLDEGHAASVQDHILQLCQIQKELI